jgi:hypothetical protein
MNLELEKIKADIDSFPEGPEKQAMLRTLEDLTASGVQKEEFERLDSKLLISRRIDRIVCLLCFSAIAFILLNGFYHGRFTNFFVKGMPYAYRGNEPYVFWFIATFLLAVSLCLLLAALRVTRIGCGPTKPSTRRAKTRAREG